MTAFVKVLVFAILLLAGCRSEDLFPENRYGPMAVSGERSRESYRQQQKILDHLIKMAFPKDFDRIEFRSAAWYQVALAGYDFVDHRCDEYLYELYVNAKRKTRAASLITATGTATGTILQLSDVSRASIGIVAAAFGYASAFNDAYSDSYLMSIGPGVVASVVKKSRIAFRENVAAAEARGEIINSRSIASSSIRSYLELCMPVFIEGQVTDVLADAKAGTGSPNSLAGGAIGQPVVVLSRDEPEPK